MLVRVIINLNLLIDHVADLAAASDKDSKIGMTSKTGPHRFDRNRENR
jgi:hypothetical protein